MNDATADFALRARALGRAHGLFASDGPLHFGRGTGRLDVMGGIADYSGSLVLQLPLPCAAQAAVAARDDDRLRVVSVGPSDQAARRAEFARSDVLAVRCSPTQRGPLISWARCRCCCASGARV